MCLGLMRKSLFPPTGMCFFMKLKLLRRQTSSPLLLTLKLKSSSSQLYLHTDDQTLGHPKKTAPAERAQASSLYLVTSYCTFCVRSTFSMMKSCKWHRLKGWLGGLRARLLFHLRVPNIAYRQIFGASSMCCSTIFREMLLKPGPPSDGSLKDTWTKISEREGILTRQNNLKRSRNV